MTDLPYHTLLSADQQRAAGIETPAPYAMADKVRFGEIDMLGHVNNAAYLSWFETVRTRYVKDYGLTGYNPGHDPRIVIRSAEIHYIREMLRDEDYIVTARTTAFRTTSFTIEQNLWSATLRARFSCVIVTLEPNGSAKRALPEGFVNKIKKTDGASPH